MIEESSDVDGWHAFDDRNDHKEKGIALNSSSLMTVKFEVIEHFFVGKKERLNDRVFSYIADDVVSVFFILMVSVENRDLEELTVKGTS